MHYSLEQVVCDFDGRLKSFQHGFLRGGALSFGVEAFAEEFGADVARFFEAAASDPEKGILLDGVLAETSMLRKHFPEAPPGAERVVMEVVSESVGMFPRGSTIDQGTVLITCFVGRTFWPLLFFHQLASLILVASIHFAD